ncbi:MAG: hypothetical protein IKU62_04710 [Ruminiclostridium sp.]|nr:hypothetical protein [Ruminiclostridium sp.]
MAEQVTNYRCPACTGPVHFNGTTGKLECDYCGSSYTVEEMEKLYAQKNEEADAKAAAQEKKAPSGDGWDTSDLIDDWGADGDGMKAYSCPTCGAELICEETTAATSCPYCGNPSIVPGQFSGALKPDFVIPFKKTKEDAVKALKDHCKGKFLLPKSFSKDHHIQEIQGIYVPFWLFDGEVEGDMTLNAVQIRTFRRGNQEITETDHFLLRREGSIAFEKIPVDGSRKMPDGHMDAIEPFDYGEMVPFQRAYLPGFLADRYDVSAEDSAKRADDRAEDTARNALYRTAVGFGGVTIANQNYHIHRGKVHYALLPVWMLNTKWNGKDYLFAMNGQTGKFIGELPVDKGRLWTLFAGVAAPVAAVMSVVLRLFL